MLSNLKIGVRLMLGFGVIVALILAIIFFSFRGLATMHNSTDRIVNAVYAKAEAASDALTLMQSVVRSIDLIVMQKDRNAQEKEKENIAALRVKYSQAMKRLEELNANATLKIPKEREILDRIKVAIKPAAEANNRAVTLALAGKNDEALQVLVNEATPLCNKLFETLHEMSQYQKERVQARYMESVDMYNTTRWILALGSVAVVSAALILALLMTLGITRPLGAMLAMLRDVAQGEGDLTKRLDASRKDELGETSRFFNLFVDKIHSIISQVANTSMQVASASTQLHSTAEQIATGAEEVSSQAGTVSVASEEMAATSCNIAHNCLSAAETSNRASDTARSGVTVVQETINGMERITGRVKYAARTVEDLGTRSEQIGAIVVTIEDIADQTNLLALNAAIEAARAGEQGRGFAVVADEVRALAERTSRATHEISEMIKAIQNETRGAVAAMEEGVAEVEKGTEFSVKSGQALDMILSQISDVSMQVNQIATAAEEQTATTSEITNNIQQITDVVQSTARGALETANAAGDLSRRAEELQRLVGQFRLA